MTVKSSRWEPIDGWRRQFTRLWSVRLQAVGLFLLSWASMPLDLWNLLPVELRSIVPAGTATALSAGFFVAAIVARFIKQKQLIDDLRS